MGVLSYLSDIVALAAKTVISTTFALVASHFPDIELLFESFLPASMMDFLIRCFTTSQLCCMHDNNEILVSVHIDFQVDLYHNLLPAFRLFRPKVEEGVKVEVNVFFLYLGCPHSHHLCNCSVFIMRLLFQSYLLMQEEYLLPVYQRRDGATIKLGYLVKRTNGDQTAFVVKQILTKKDMATVTLTLVPYQMAMKTGEQLIIACRVEEVSCVRGRRLEAVVAMARDGMADIAASISSYPVAMQRQVRKHQVAASLRREVQRFLGDVVHTSSLNLGPVDWRLDPGILGLDRHADFTLVRI